MLNLSLSTIIITAVNLLVLLGGLYLLLIKPVRKIIAERQAEADRDFEAAAAKQTEADTLKAKYEESLKSAETEKKKIIAEARKTADSEAQKIVKDAEDTAKEMKREAVVSAEKQKSQILKSAEQDIANLALDAAVKVVGGKSGADLDSALYNEFLDKAGDK